jgi:hypothetical protein
MRWGRRTAYLLPAKRPESCSLRSVCVPLSLGAVLGLTDELGLGFDQYFRVEMFDMHSSQSNRPLRQRDGSRRSKQVLFVLRLEPKRSGMSSTLKAKRPFSSEAEFLLYAIGGPTVRLLT